MGKLNQVKTMIQELTDEQLNTYARQIVLSSIGYDGQLKLRNSSACIVGLGGLGSLIAPKIVGMGIGQLRIVDRDIVSRSDLHRQYLYNVDDVGRPKVEAALIKLSRINPDVEIIPYPESLTSYNASEIIAGVDIVLDGLDRPEPRYVINRTCIQNEIPFVFAGAIETYANVTTIVPGQSLCLECFIADLTEEDLPKCGVVGVHPSILGIVTSIQVFEAVSVLIGQRPKLINKLMYIDLSQMAFKTLTLSAKENCPVCGAMPRESLKPLIEKLVEETCSRDGQRNFIVSPRKRVDINLDQLCSILSEKGFGILAIGQYGITFKRSDVITASILKSGVMIVQISPGLEDFQKDDVLDLYHLIIVENLGVSSEILPNV